MAKSCWICGSKTLPSHIPFFTFPFGCEQCSSTSFEFPCPIHFVQSRERWLDLQRVRILFRVEPTLFIPPSPMVIAICKPFAHGQSIVLQRIGQIDTPLILTIVSDTDTASEYASQQDFKKTFSPDLSRDAAGNLHPRWCRLPQHPKREDPSFCVLEVRLVFFPM